MNGQSPRSCDPRCRRRGLVSAAALVAVLGLGGSLACRPSPPSSPSPDTLALSDLGEVTRADLAAYLVTLPAERRQPETGAEPRAWRLARLEDLLLRRALVAEGRRLGLADAPGGRAELDRTRDELLAKLARGWYLSQHPVAIGDAAVRAYYAGHPEQFGHGELLRLSHLFRRVEGGASPEQRRAVRREIEELRALAGAGAHFADLARDHSHSETARLGGALGRVARGQLDPAVEAVVWALAPGEISQVVATPAGFQLFRLEERIPAAITDLDEVRGTIRRRLAARAGEELRRQMLAELLTESGAAYHPERLDPAWEPGDAILFALPASARGEGEEPLTLGQLGASFAARPFAEQRTADLERLLEDAVIERLLVWRARRADFAGLEEAMSRLEEEVLVDLAWERRRRAWLEALDDRELQEFFATQSARFRTPRRLRLGLISRPFLPGQPPYGVYRELAKVAAALRAGSESFSDAARRLSADPSAAAGGDLGWVRPEDFYAWAGADARREVVTLAPGEVSPPLLLQRLDPEAAGTRRVGYLLVRLDAVEESRLPAFAEVRSEVAEAYYRQRRAEADAALRAEVLGSISTVLFEDQILEEPAAEEPTVEAKP